MVITRAQLKILLQDTQLTPQEILIARMTTIGYTTAQMSRILHIEPESVRGHRKHIYAKVDVHNVTQLTIWALDAGLIEPEDIPCLTMPPAGRGDDGG